MAKAIEVFAEVPPGAEMILSAGALPKFLPETESVRTSAWKVADTPADMQISGVKGIS